MYEKALVTGLCRSGVWINHIWAGRALRVRFRARIAMPLGSWPMPFFVIKPAPPSEAPRIREIPPSGDGARESIGRRPEGGNRGTACV